MLTILYLCTMIDLHLNRCRKVIPAFSLILLFAGIYGHLRQKI